jgi:hypothetical protein
MVKLRVLLVASYEAWVSLCVIKLVIRALVYKIKKIQQVRDGGIDSTLIHSFFLLAYLGVHGFSVVIDLLLSLHVGTSLTEGRVGGSYHRARVVVPVAALGGAHVIHTCSVVRCK